MELHSGVELHLSSAPAAASADTLGLDLSDSMVLPSGESAGTPVLVAMDSGSVLTSDSLVTDQSGSLVLAQQQPITTATDILYTAPHEPQELQASAHQVSTATDYPMLSPVTTSAEDMSALSVVTVTSHDMVNVQ